MRKHNLLISFVIALVIVACSNRLIYETKKNKTRTLKVEQNVKDSINLKNKKR